MAVTLYALPVARETLPSVLTRIHLGQWADYLPTLGNGQIIRSADRRPTTRGEFSGYAEYRAGVFTLMSIFTLMSNLDGDYWAGLLGDLRLCIAAFLSISAAIDMISERWFLNPLSSARATAREQTMK